MSSGPSRSGGQQEGALHKGQTTQDCRPPPQEQIEKQKQVLDCIQVYAQVLLLSIETRIIQQGGAIDNNKT